MDTIENRTQGVSDMKSFINGDSISLFTLFFKGPIVSIHTTDLTTVSLNFEDMPQFDNKQNNNNNNNNNKLNENNTIFVSNDTYEQ